VGAGASVYAVTTGGEVRVLAEALDHPAQRLGFDDGRLLVGGDISAEAAMLTVLDPATGEVLDTIDLPAAPSAPSTGGSVPSTPPGCCTYRGRRVPSVHGSPISPGRNRRCRSVMSCGQSPPTVPRCVGSA